jgi:hypothetical protein
MFASHSVYLRVNGNSMTTSIIKSLRSTKRKIKDHIAYPSQPGIYGFFLSANSKLDKFGNPGQLIYVGIAKTSLKQRDLNQHFKSGKSGSSTLRRSIGAVLKVKFKFKSIPRGGTNDSKRFENYKFSIICEDKLSKWMDDNLEVGYWTAGPTIDYKKLRNLEMEVIKQLLPTLDLDKRTSYLNPLAGELISLRNICRDEAKCNC